MSFVYSALADKPAGLWELGNDFTDRSGGSKPATAAGTVSKALSLTKGALNSSIVSNTSTLSFPTTVFQQGNEDKAFSLEAWVDAQARTSGYMAQPYRENLAVNPSAEINTQGFGPANGAVLTRQSSSAILGGYGINVSCPANGIADSGINLTSGYPIVSGTTYTVSVYIRALTADTFNLSLQNSAGDGSRTPITLAANQIGRVSHTWTAPVNGFVSSYILRGKSASVVNFDVDAVLLEESPNLGAYFDGSMSGYEWSGAAHASISRTRKDVSKVNYMLNPSFEDSSLPGISLANGAASSSSTTQALSGARSLKLSNTVTSADSFASFIITGLTPSTNYILSAWIFVESIVGGASGNRAMMVTNSSGNVGYGADTTLSTNHPIGVWTKKSLSFPTADTETSVRIRLYVPNGVVYWDNVQVEQGLVSTSYFDGSSSGAFWLGTTNNSVSVMSPSILEAQALGNNNQYDGLVINGTKAAFVTKYTTTGEARAEYDLEHNRAVHLVGVHTSDKNSLYIDGQLVAETAITDVQKADTFTASDGKLYAGQTLSSQALALNGVGLYTYALKQDAIQRHFQEGRNTPTAAEVPTFYGGDRMVPSLEHSDTFMNQVFTTAADWSGGQFTNTVIINDELTPQFSGDTSVAGTWLTAIPLASAGSSIYGIMLDWDGSGATVETSLDGITWTTVLRGVKTGSVAEGTDPTGKMLFVRVTFAGGIVDDESYISNLRVVGYNTGVVSVTSARTLTLVNANTEYEFAPLQLNDQWGAAMGAGGTATISADSSPEALPIRTVEAWIKPTSSTFPSINVAGVSYLDGVPMSGGAAWAVGQWRLWHFVLNADLTNSLIISGQCQLGQVAVYPTALTAVNIVDIYGSYTGSGSAVVPVSDANSVIMTEPAQSANIYAYDWSITQSG